MIKINYLVLFLLAVMALMFLSMPFFFVLMILFICIFVPQKYGFLKKQLFSFFIVAMFGYINYMKQIDGDLISYAELISELSRLNIVELPTYKYTTFDFSEPIFMMFTYIISKITIDIHIYVFFTTVIFYLVVIASFHIIYDCYSGKSDFSKTMNLNGIDLNKYICLLTITALSFNFSLVAHLVKQYLAMALLFLSIAFYIKNEYKYFVFYIFLSVMTHNSMIIPASILLFCYISFVLRQIKIVFAVLLALMLIFHQYFLFLSTFVIDYSDLSDGVIPLYVIIVDILIFILSILFGNVFGFRENKVTLLVLLYFIFLLSIRNFNLLFLRYYFSFDILRALLLIYLFNQFRLVDCKTEFRIFLGFSSIFLILYLFIIRLLNSTWIYGSDTSSFLFSTLF